MLIIYLIVLIFLSSYAHAHRILVVFSIPGKSHGILGEALVEHLLNDGHEITYVTPNLMKSSNPRLNQVDISENLKYFSGDFFDINNLMKNEFNLQDHLTVLEIFDNLWYNTLKTDAVQNFIFDPKEEYDLVIVEWLFNEYGAGFSTVFNCPLIWFSPVVLNTFVTSLVDENLNPSYTGHFLSKEYSFSFFDRVSYLYSFIRTQLYNWLNTQKDNKKFKSLFESAVIKRGRSLPHYVDVKYNASLILGDSDAVTSYNVAIPQNYKHIGGYHINRTVPKLPNNLQEIMDNSRDGVIYFSLGTHVRVNSMSQKIQNDLLNLFSGLKQTVIWKLELVIPNLPKNVNIVTWAPQSSVLDHPNCVLFITHGGLLSTFETLNFGIPIIGMPFFADQFFNINRAVQQGYGRRVDFNENVASTLKVAVEEMLNDSRYTQKAKELSKIFKERITSPDQELKYWVNHVIETKGAPHLRSVALKYSWFTKLYIDFIIVVLIMIIILFYIIKKIFGRKVHNKLD